MMGDMKRRSLQANGYGGVGMYEDKDGPYVLFTDHERVVAELREAHEKALAEGRDPHRTCTSCWMNDHDACTRGEKCLCRACDEERGYARGLGDARDAVAAHIGDSRCCDGYEMNPEHALDAIDALRDPAPAATAQDIADDRAEHEDREEGVR